MKTGKKFVVWVTIFTLLLGTHFSAKMASAKTKKYGYLGGANSFYEDFKIKYKGHKLYMKGYVWKTDGNKIPRYSIEKKKKKIKKTVKITNDCKINFGDETEWNFKFKNKKKVNQFFGKENTWFSAPSVYIVVSGNKAVYLSLGS